MITKCRDDSRKGYRDVSRSIAGRGIAMACEKGL